MNGTRICSLAECQLIHYGLGYCRKHYRRFKTTGDPRKVLTGGPSVDRFLASVPKRGPGCWIWGGALNETGYGTFRSKDISSKLAHRYSAKMLGGLDIDGLDVRHKCDNPPCVNPEHLEVGTHAENMRDMKVRRRSGHLKKTHCPQGHAYVPENIYWRRDGGRKCKTCELRRGKEVDARPSACPICGQKMTHGSVRGHVRRMHAESSKSPDK